MESLAGYGCHYDLAYTRMSKWWMGTVKVLQRRGKRKYHYPGLMIVVGDVVCGLLGGGK